MMERSELRLITLLLSLDFRVKTAEKLAAAANRRELSDKEKAFFMAAWKEAESGRPDLAKILEKEVANYHFFLATVSKKAPVAYLIHRVISGDPQRQYAEYIATWETITKDEMHRQMARVHPAVEASAQNLVSLREQYLELVKREKNAITRLSGK